MNTLIKTLQEELENKMKSFTSGVVREINFPNISNKIMVAIGMRRTGKTYLLLQTIQALLKERIPISRILYINFEDDRLTPMNQKQFGQLVDSFYTLYPENHDSLCYLFFDEIQNVEDWHLVIRRFFDTKKVKIYLTGSSAKLLSKEINTSLRGRSLATEVWPFSFKEFLTANQVSCPDTKLLGKQGLDKLGKQLIQYLADGGFPEIIQNNSEDMNIHMFQGHIQTLQDYVSVVIFRDIIERYKIANIALIKYMIKSLLNNVGGSFSVHKFYDDLKSQGFSVGKTTLYEYLSYIEDAYLAFAVPLYSKSIRKAQVNPRKIYAIDTGLVNAYTRYPTANKGHIFENLIYLDLRRQKHEVYYYLTETRREVDFLSKDLFGQWYLTQVCLTMNDSKTMERETLALKEAEQELKMQGLDVKGQIITPDSYLSSLSFMQAYKQASQDVAGEDELTDWDKIEQD